MRKSILVALLLVLLSLAWVWIGSVAGPLTRSCAPELQPGACDAAISAVLRRGTPVPHPAILAARVDPGNAPAFDQFGHRATVTYTMAALPPTATIELYFDQGAHWGGRTDPSEDTLRLLALEPMLVALLMGATIVAFAWRRRNATG